MNTNLLYNIVNFSFFSRISPFVVKELRQELRSRFLFLCLWLSTIILLTVFIAETAELKNENLASVLANGGSMDSVYYFCCSISLLLIATGRTNRNFMREMDAGSLDLLYLTGLRSFDIFLGKWIALGLQGLLIMIALFPFALIGYFMSGEDIPSMLLKSAGLYLLFLVLISLTLADTAQEGTKGRGGRVGFTMGIITYIVFTSTRFFSAMGTYLIYELILEQIVDPLGLAQLLLTIIAIVGGIRLTLHRGATSIAPPFEKTVLLRQMEAMLLGSILCVISIGRGFTLLAASGLLAYFAHVGVLTTVNLITERQRKVVVERNGITQGRLLAILKTDGWRGGSFIVLYLCIATTVVQVLAGTEPWRAISIGIIIASSILASRFYLRIIETKRDSRFWDFVWFQVILNIMLAFFSYSKSEAAGSPFILLLRIAEPTTLLSNSILFAVTIHLLIILAVLSLAILGPVECRDETLVEPEEPLPARETPAHD